MISANGSAAKYQAETALNEAVEEEEEDGDDAPHVNGHVSGELEDTGTLADDEAEVTDIRKEEDQGETKEVVGTPQPVNEESEEKADEGKEEENEERPKENAADDDVTEEQNKVNEEIEVSKSPAPSENKASLQNGISDHSSNNEEVIEKDHKRLEGMF